MPDFKGGKEIALPAYDGGTYTLYKRTWDIKLDHPERAHIEFNFAQVVETLRNPDEVRCSSHTEDCFIAYKWFEKYWVRPGISAPVPLGLNYMAVVHDAKRRVIKTFYPTKHMKEGVRVWPKNERGTK